MIIGKALIAMVRLYQATISPWKGETCRFHPSCSAYFIEAVQKRGALTGAVLGLWRILRCTPFSRGGYDPVPAPREESKSHSGGGS